MNAKTIDRRQALADRRLAEARAMGERIEAYIAAERRGNIRRGQDAENAYFDNLEKET